jgi:hypothetical protein
MFCLGECAGTLIPAQHQHQLLSEHTAPGDDVIVGIDTNMLYLFYSYLLMSSS